MNIMKPIPATLEARILKLRFPLSGLVTSVNCMLGDRVKKGQVLATLDNTILKKRQEKELKDYDKMRMQFEEVKRKGDTLLLERMQKDLDTAVLAVEISDWETRHSSIVCPEDGIILDDGGLAAGMYASPASFEIELQVAGSEFARAEVDQDTAYTIKRDDLAEFRLDNGKKTFVGRLLRVLPSPRSGYFFADAIFSDIQELMPGSVGTLTIKPNA